MKSSKSTSKFRVGRLITFVILFSIISYGLWFGYNTFFAKTEAENTSIQNKIENKLKDAKDDNEKMKLNAELFVSEYFSFRNRLKEGDIGGQELFIPEGADSFKSYAVSNYYKWFNSAETKFGKSGLPEVSKIDYVSESPFDKLSFLIGTDRQTFSGKKFEFNFSYDASTKEETLYHHKATVYVTVKDKKIYIVKWESN